MWVGAQARSDSIFPADVLSDCLQYDPSAWPGHPLDTHRSDGVTSSRSLPGTGPSLSCPSSRRCGVTPTQTNEGMTVTTLPRCITSGVDTHLDVHEAAALDERGTLLGVENFATTEIGYKKMLGWLSDFGPVELVGVEGTGSYGAGLTRHLQAEGVRVVEVDRPNRQRRRLKGKSHPQDAISAARAALSGDAIGQAKSRDGNVESMRDFRVARASARKDRTQALNQMRNMVSTAPDLIRAELRGLSVFHLLERASSYGPKPSATSSRSPSSRFGCWRATLSRSKGISEIDAILKPLAKETAPAVVATLGIGTDAASALLVAAGDNLGRLRNEAAFAHLCGTSLLDASNGKNQRHRLIKRYVAREVFSLSTSRQTWT